MSLVKSKNKTAGDEDLDDEDQTGKYETNLEVVQIVAKVLPQTHIPYLFDLLVSIRPCTNGK